MVDAPSLKGISDCLKTPIVIFVDCVKEFNMLEERMKRTIKNASVLKGGKK